jgi:hypothetical protein
MHAFVSYCCRFNYLIWLIPHATCIYFCFRLIHITRGKKISTVSQNFYMCHGIFFLGSGLRYPAPACSRATVRERATNERRSGVAGAAPGAHPTVVFLGTTINCDSRPATTSPSPTLNAPRPRVQQVREREREGGLSSAPESGDFFLLGACWSS